MGCMQVIIYNNRESFVWFKNTNENLILEFPVGHLSLYHATTHKAIDIYVSLV